MKCPRPTQPDMFSTFVNEMFNSTREIWPSEADHRGAFLHSWKQRLSSRPLPARLGMFAYLVQGQGELSEFWKTVGQRNDTRLFWLSWRKRLSEDYLPRVGLGKLQYVYFPKSTFTYGRNRLFALVKEAEKNQQWRFEYLVFADEDMETLQIRSRPFDSRLSAASGTNAHPESITLLNRLLLLYKPARAGGYTVWLQSDETMKRKHWRLWCWQTAPIDAALEAFSRNAADIMLPYYPGFDRFNVWVSAALMNLKASLILGKTSVTFSQLWWSPTASGNAHAKYPRSGGPHIIWAVLKLFLETCLPRNSLLRKNGDFVKNIQKLYGTNFGVCPPSNLSGVLEFNPDFIRQNWIDEQSPVIIQCGEYVLQNIEKAMSKCRL